MTQPGRAAIEIVGDASKLGPQLERDAQRAINDVDVDTTNISRQIGDGFRKGADDASDAIAELGDGVERTFRDIQSDSENLTRALSLDAEEIAAKIGVAVETAQRWIEGLREPIDVNRRALIKLGASVDDVDDSFARARRSAEDATEGVGEFGRGARKALGGLGDTITSLGSALVGLGLTGTNPLGLATLALEVIAVAAAIPVVIGLAAALADLVGFVTLLPAAIGGAAASIIVLTVAFNGFGDAISAVLEGDPEKIAEAMERLAPAARVVVREFQRVLPIFRDVGKEIQQGFFVRLDGILGRFGTTTLPRVRDELRILSATLGDALAGLASLLTAPENIGILERLFGSTARSVDALGEAFHNLGQAFFNSIDAGLPSLEALSTRLADAISGFAGFINTSIADGSFQAFLDDAIATLDELLDLGGAVGELLGVLFSGTDDAGRDFIGTLTDLTQRLTEFFKSAEGQDALEDFGEIMGAVGIILGAIVNVVRETIDIFTDLDDAVNATITWFDDLGSTLSDIWDTIVSAVSVGIEAVVGFFSALPEKISAFVDSIPGRVSAAFQALADAALTALAFLIAGVIVFFTDLPGQVVGSLVALANLLSDTWDTIVLKVFAAFTNARTFIITTWENILTFFSELPTRASGFFQQMVDAVIARATSLVEYVKSVPGRILTALGDVARLLYNSGANIIQGLIDGIGSRIGQLRDKIAGAVQTIRDHLPFSPAKTGPLSGSGSPQIAGAVIAEMIAAGLDAGTPLISQAAGRAASATTSPFGAIGQAGVNPLTSPVGTPAGASVLSPVEATTELQPVFVVRIGNEDIEAFIDKRVDERVQIETRRLLAGSRGI